MYKINVYKIITVLILLIVISYLVKKTENFTPDEVIQNLGRIYTTDNMRLTNLTVTGNLDVSGLLNTQNFNAFNFRGIVVAFSGAYSDIPKGWAYCDGNSYKLNDVGVAVITTPNDVGSLKTPDLKNRFIYGYNKDDLGISARDISGYSRGRLEINDTGGLEYHKLTKDELPPHVHIYETFNQPTKSGTSTTDQVPNYWTRGNKYTENQTDPTTYNRFNNMPEAKLLNYAHNNMPPYIVLAYIMKL